MSVGGVLVTGGAGYIGSHVVRQLGERGERVVVLDDLSTGFSQSVLYGELVRGEVGDQALVSALIEEHGVDTVMHFAAKTIVPESVSDPLLYYQSNSVQTCNLLQCCVEKGVRNFVFSSTAAVYGIPDSGVASEKTPTAPINPYGASKLISEWMLRDTSAAAGLRTTILRYFNVAGCDPGGRIGQSTRKATLLIKVLCEAALGKRRQVNLYGTDYDTRDGTCIRDYIHVEDLSSAHLCALDYLRDGGKSEVLNCGYGRGFTVREVISEVERCHGSSLPIIETDRRPGDPPELIAEAQKIRKVLRWTPQYDDLSLIVKSALQWEEMVAGGAAGGTGNQ